MHDSQFSRYTIFDTLPNAPEEIGFVSETFDDRRLCNDGRCRGDDLALSSERRGDRTCWDPLTLSCCALRASSCRRCSIWNPEGVNRVNNTTSGQLFLRVTAHWQQEKAHQPARYQAINTRESPQIFIGSLPTSSLNLTLGWLRAGVVQLGNRLYRKHVDNRGHRACRWSLAKKTAAINRQRTKQTGNVRCGSLRKAAVVVVPMAVSSSHSLASTKRLSLSAAASAVTPIRSIGAGSVNPIPPTLVSIASAVGGEFQPFE
jgi:hypothetical protein